MEEFNIGNVEGPREAGVYERMPDGSLRTAIPEPFWIKNWRTLWFWRPACYQCRTTYKSRDEYQNHYIMHHAYSEEPR